MKEINIFLSQENLLEKAWLVLVFLVITELDLALYSSENTSFFLSNRMRAI